MAAKNINRPTKMLADRLRSCRVVHWSLETYGRKLLEILSEIFGPALEASAGEAPFEPLLELLKGHLTKVLDALVQSDRRLRDAKAKATKARIRRDEAHDELSAKVRALRDAFGGVYGSEETTTFGFAQQTPEQSEELLEQATHLIARLKGSGADAPNPQWEGLDFDPSALAEKLEPAVEALRQALEGVSREERAIGAAIVAKEAALKEFNQSFLWIARTVESLFRLAGLDELARRVRPSIRRQGVTEEESEAPEDTGQEPVSDSDSDEASESASASSSEPHALSA